MRTLSLWECDKVYPAWKHQPLLEEYLGFSPFQGLAYGCPEATNHPALPLGKADRTGCFGEDLRRLRLTMRLTRRECAVKLGMDPKTVWGWETGRHLPTRSVREEVLIGLEKQIQR